MALEDLDMDGIGADIKRIEAMVKRMQSGEEMTDEFIEEMNAGISGLERKVKPVKEES